jgi:hypothetical protein
MRDPQHAARLLRERRPLHGEGDQWPRYRRAAEECDEFAPPHARPLDPMASKEYGSNTPRQVGRIAAVPPNPAVWL